MSEALRRGREHYDRKAWSEARRELAAADREAALGPDDLERLAIAAYLTGHDAENIDLLARGHHEFLTAGNPARAARCAFWLGFRLMDTGDRAQAGGWLSRAHRLLEESKLDCVERGFLLLPQAFQLAQAGDLAAANAIFTEAAAIAKRFQDRDLLI